MPAEGALELIKKMPAEGALEGWGLANMALVGLALLSYLLKTLR